MANLIAEPSFETKPTTEWQFAGNYSHATGFGNPKDGLFVVILSADWGGSKWSNAGGFNTTNTIKTIPNLPHGFSIWLNALNMEGSGNVPNFGLEAQFNDGSGYQVFATLSSVASSHFGTNEWFKWKGEFTPTSNATRIAISVITFDAPDGPAAWNWVLDVCEVEEPNVSVILGELARKAVLKTLQDNISAELTAIVTERADGLTLPAPTSWYGYERQAASPDGVEVEVYRSADGITFPSWMSRDKYDGGENLVQSEVGMVVAINHANRDNVKASEMQDRSDRYAAAVIRIMRDNVALGVSDVIQVTPERVAISERALDKVSGNISRVDRVEVYLTVALLESPTGEGQAGGGVPPVASTETVS